MWFYLRLTAQDEDGAIFSNLIPENKNAVFGDELYCTFRRSTGSLEQLLTSYFLKLKAHNGEKKTFSFAVTHSGLHVPYCN